MSLVLTFKVPKAVCFVARFSVVCGFARLELFELKFPMLPVCYSEFSEKPLSSFRPVAGYQQLFPTFRRACDERETVRICWEGQILL